MATTLDMILGTADGDGTPARLTQQTVRVVQPETPPMEPGPDEYVNTVAQAAKPPVTVAQAQQETQGADKRHMSYKEMTQLLSPYTPPTEEELAKERKKQKRDKMFAAISDGLRAMHEAYSYGRGVKPMTSGPSMSATVRTRYEQLKRERDAQKGAYLNAYMRALQMDDEAARDDRNWRHTLEREKLGDQYKEREFAIREAKADHDAAMNDLKVKLYMGKIDQQNYENEVARIKAQYQERLSQSQINKNNRQPSRSGSGKPAEYPWYDKDGNLHYAHSEAAARENSRLHGTWKDNTQTSTTTRKSGRKTTTTTTVKPSKGQTVKPKKGARTRALGL